MGSPIPGIRSAQLVVACPEFQATLDFFVERLGFRVDAIFPADAPSTAVISGYGTTLRLEQSEKPSAGGNAHLSFPQLRLLCDGSALPEGVSGALTAPNGMSIELVPANPPIDVPEGRQEFVICRVGAASDFGAGRAGMQYRDLIPNRLGGRFVASHICIPDGGPVPDYVHYHRVRFQMIFCKAGWVKVVYEDQGPPFVMHAGDCVLQPPEIRHQVLEASPGLEVVEIGCPAMHETGADHELRLPNDRINPSRLFAGQRFVRHIAAGARWAPWKIKGFEKRDTGVTAATNGLAAVQVIRSSGGRGTILHEGEFLFFFVLRGELGVRSDKHGSIQLRDNESCVIPAGMEFELSANPEVEMLVVAVPADSWN